MSFLSSRSSSLERSRSFASTSLSRASSIL
nr:MAG TPA: hypothetical protein [Caudoviricetes sp.]